MKKAKENKKAAHLQRKLVHKILSNYDLICFVSPDTPFHSLSMLNSDVRFRVKVKSKQKPKV